MLFTLYFSVSFLFILILHHQWKNAKSDFETAEILFTKPRGDSSRDETAASTASPKPK